jgi:restriction system protein
LTRHGALLEPDNGAVNGLDDAVEATLWTIGRQPGWAVAAVAGVLYAGIGWALPLALDLPWVWLIGLNFVGSVWAGLVIVTWIAVHVQARERRHLVDWTTDLRLLSSTEFEWFVGEVFRREGWTVDETGTVGRPDGNVDLRLRKGQDSAIVQCKRWASWAVGVDDIRGFAGTLHAEGTPSLMAIFVTLSEFTDAARAEADRAGIALIDGPGLHARVEKVRSPEACPECRAAMILSHSDFGWWFRCRTPGCRGKRDLGSEPARAVALLT